MLLCLFLLFSLKVILIWLLFDSKSTLKGLSHEIDFKNGDKNLQNFAAASDWLLINSTLHW